jgi:hypothetical protein
MMGNTLTRGQQLVLVAATLPMIGAGVAGGLGTYTNIATEFGRAETALGVVAAGEGVTLVLALVMVGLTMLGQAAPLPVRAGLWLAPAAAALTGVVVADGVTEAVVYAMTPMAMSASAEGLGLLARRIVVHRTGVDVETQRRNAETVQRLAYHRARAANHPKPRARKRSELASWRLAKRVGVGDTELGAQLVEVQRERLLQGADTALLDMLAVQPAAAPVATEVTVERADEVLLPAVEEPLEVVTAPVIELPAVTPVWDDWAASKVTTVPWFEDHTRAPLKFDAERQQWEPVADRPMPAAVPAETTREVVTESLGLTPTELRKRARVLHRQVVRSGGRGVTIAQLQDEFGLSRRDATALRREVVTEVAS